MSTSNFCSDATFVANSFPPTMSAPAFSASDKASPPAKTAILTSLPVPFGREVERILGSNEEVEVKKESPKFKPDFEVGETVRVTTGPFADFNGIIEEINLDQSKVTVLVNIFGRETPVELGFTDIVKN